MVPPLAWGPLACSKPGGSPYSLAFCASALPLRVAILALRLQGRRTNRRATPMGQATAAGGGRRQAAGGRRRQAPASGVASAAAHACNKLLAATCKPASKRWGACLPIQTGLQVSSRRCCCRVCSVRGALRTSWAAPPANPLRRLAAPALASSLLSSMALGAAGCDETSKNAAMQPSDGPEAFAQPSRWRRPAGGGPAHVILLHRHAFPFRPHHVREASRVHVRWSAPTASCCWLWSGSPTKLSGALNQARNGSWLPHR